MPEAIGYLITALCTIIVFMLRGIFRIFRTKRTSQKC